MSSKMIAEELMIVAHRGASRVAPENTIPAFNAAWKQDADAIEGDFYRTKDDQIVCIHDANTQKVAGRNLIIAESSLADLRKLDVGGYREEYRGTVIPTIAEVFATIPEKKTIYIDIKSDKSIVPGLLSEIRKSYLKQDQIIIISFDAEVIRTIKGKAPQYRAFWLSAFEKDNTGTIAPSLETVLKTLKQIKADGFSSKKDIINEAFIRSLIEKEYEYHVWTVDDLETARHFIKWGAKSITTNVPGYIRQHLIEDGYTVRESV